MNLPPVLRQRYLDADGEPLINGKLFTYQAGTTTPQVTYTDATGLTPNTNPIILNSNGEAAMWLDPALSYKFVLKDSNDITQWTTDGVVGSLTDDSVGTSTIQDGAVTADKIADGVVDFTKLSTNVFGPSTQLNFGITAAVGSGDLVITLKTLDGSVPSILNPVRMAFRNLTAATGLTTIRDITSAISLTVPSGATLGGSNGVLQSLYVIAIDDNGTIELGVVGSRLALGEGSRIATSEISSGADDALTAYSEIGRTNVPYRVLGRIKSTQATAGTWSTAPSDLSLAVTGWDSWEGRADLGQQVSASSGDFTDASGLFVDVTNLSVSLTTSGRPVHLSLINDGSGNGCSIGNGSGGSQYRFVRGATSLGVYPCSSGITIPASCLQMIDASPAAGTYTYKVQLSSGINGFVKNAKLIAYEL